MYWPPALGIVLALAAPATADTFLVLPFLNGTGNSNLAWVGESISESLREALANEGVMTLDREGRQEAYRRLGLRPYAPLTRATVVKVGQVLDADQVVFGEFDLVPPADKTSASRGSLKITARILDLRRMKQGPEFAEIAALEDLASQQARLAWQTLEFISPQSTPGETDYLKQWPQVRVQAIEAHVRGLLAEQPEQKLKLFLQAMQVEPNYSPAAYQLGLLAYSKKDFRGATNWLMKVAKNDVHYRQANFYLGICRFNTADYAAAETAFQLVAAAVPLNEVYNNLGAAQSRRNNAEALDNFAKALEGDSSDPVYHFNVGYALWKQSKFAAAAERFRAVLDRDPRDGEATLMLGRCLKQSGPSSAELRSNGLERVKTNYEESAYWQLKAVLQPEKKQ